MSGTTWHPGCPVALDGLRLLHFNYWGFGGNVLRGPMVVNASAAEDVLWVFHRLYDARFPIKRVSLSTPFHPKAFAQHRRIDSNRSVTASFNCRPVVTALGPSDSFSQHAYGLAIDLNPLQNPYVTSDGFVRNRAAEPYTDRSGHLEGMIHEGDVVVRSFAAIGWSWGGNWSGDKDYMHFSSWRPVSAARPCRANGTPRPTTRSPTRSSGGARPSSTGSSSTAPRPCWTPGAVRGG